MGAQVRRYSFAGRLLAALQVVSRCPAVQAVKVLRRGAAQQKTQAHTDGGAAFTNRNHLQTKASKKADTCTCVNSMDDAAPILPTWTDLSLSAAGGTSTFTDPICAKEFSGKCNSQYNGSGGLTGDEVFKVNVNPQLEYYFDASKNFFWRRCDLQCRTESNGMCKAYQSDTSGTCQFYTAVCPNRVYLDDTNGNVEIQSTQMMYSLEQNTASCIEATDVPQVDDSNCAVGYGGQCQPGGAFTSLLGGTNPIVISTYNNRAYTLSECRYLCSKTDECKSFFLENNADASGKRKCYLMRDGCGTGTDTTWTGYNLASCDLQFPAQEWLTPQKDDTDYGKAYTLKYGGGPNYGEFCAAWEDTETVASDGKNGKAGANYRCADPQDRPDWCTKKWCYVKAAGAVNGNITENPLDLNAPGAPDGPNCDGLSDVTKSINGEDFIWYSYQICEGK